jgi:hypothetical protein
MPFIAVVVRQPAPLVRKNAAVSGIEVFPDRCLRGGSLLSACLLCCGEPSGEQVLSRCTPAIATLNLQVLASCLDTRIERDSPKNHANHL